MNPLRYIKALFGLGDVDAFWMAREEILKRPGKHFLENYLCKIIRKHYGAGIPILPDINRFATPHGFYGIFISQRAKVGEGCVIYQQVTIGSNDLQNSRGAPTIGNNYFIGAGAKIVGNGWRLNVFRDGVRDGFYACRFAVHLSDGEINLAQKA